jgi:serine protease inhibitor
MSMQKRNLYRIHLLLSLSLVYGCKSSQSNLLLNQKPMPMPSSNAQTAPSPSPTLSPAPSPALSQTPNTELNIQALSPAEIQEVAANPLVDANNRFALKLFNVLAEEHKQKNIFVSPLSVSLAFQMVLNGADGKNRAEMAQALEIDQFTPEQVNRGAHLLMRKLLKPAADIQLEVANAIFANDRYHLLPEFAKINQDNFLAEIRNLHFTNGPTQTEINAWVSQQTHTKIPSVLEPFEDPVEAEFWENNVVMYLINALYFKANWTHKFETFETQQKVFTLADGQKKQVPMMRQFNTFRYLGPDPADLNRNFQAIELPCGKGRQLGMYIFLPSYGASLSQMIREIGYLDLKKLFDSFVSETGSLSLPKFKLKDEFDLIKPMKALNMLIAFEGGNFSKMIQAEDILKISRAFQKSLIEVNEEGTEAAAVTVIEMAPLPSSEPMRRIEMIVDRPFMYLIRDNETGQILFMGNVYDPSVES